MKITYYGHSCFGIYTNGVHLLIDPFVQYNPIAKEKVDINTIPADLILLTHGHQDHMADAEEIMTRTNAPVLANFEIASWFEKKDFGTFGINHGGKIIWNDIYIKMVNAVHSSALPDGTYAGNPGGYVIKSNDKALYISGDTALTMDMKLIPMTEGKIDASILCLGDYFTMNYKDAAIASDFVECDKIIGCHFDSFDPIKIDHEEAIDYFQSKNKTLLLPAIGSEIDV